MNDSSEKKVDESWKEQMERERQQPASPSSAAPQQPPKQKPQKPRKEEQTPFSVFLSSLSMQVLMALGEMPHPATGLVQEEPEQARYLIDVLGLLQEKTQGNLTQEEAGLLEGLLYELRMKYVEKTQGGAPR